jgi:hypothetical protein
MLLAPGEPGRAFLTWWLMPIFAREILHGGPRTPRLCYGRPPASGRCRRDSTLASRRTVLGLGAIIGVAAMSFGRCGLIVFSFSRSTALSLALHGRSPAPA